MDASARLLRLLALLQTPPTRSGAELARRLGVDTRTLRRDIARLRDLGYPVDAVPGTSGYRLGSGAQMPPLLLDDEETVAVALALRTAARGVRGIEETSLRALSKLEQVLPARLRHRVTTLRAVTEAVVSTGEAVEVDVLTAVATACRRQERLRFDYTDQRGAVTVRDTEPLRILHQGRRWYVVAWDTGPGDWRTFRLDRVRPRTPTGPRFSPRPPPADDLTGYLTRGTSVRTYRHHGRFTLHVPIAVAAERFGPTVGVLEAVDEHTCVLHAGSDSLDELVLYVATAGFPFTTHAPPALLDHLPTLIDRLARSTLEAQGVVRAVRTPSP